MSRCFPFPPPGYTLSRPSEALIESIKLQKEREKSKEKKEKKEKRKEKKEQRKEKKDKRKEKKEKRGGKTDVAHPNLDKSDIVQGLSGDTFMADTKGPSLCKGREAETEHLERSSLTEEHGQPDRIPAPSTSSDSTENSNKRKRHTTPQQGNHAHGKIIRIRLTSKKHLDNTPNHQELCSASERIQLPLADKDDVGLRDGTDKLSHTLEENSNIRREIGIGAPPRTLVVSPRETATASIPKLNKAQRRELRYQNLFKNWAPPQLQVSGLPDDDDQDWLFAGKKENSHAEKRQRTGDHVTSCSSSSALWPRAQYLHEVDVFALPYTVPF